MAIHYEIAALNEAADAFDADAKSALPKARNALAEFEKENARLDADANAPEARRKLSGEEWLAEKGKVRATGIGAVNSAAGDVPAALQSLATIGVRAAFEGAEGIEANAAHVPLPPPDASPTAGYMFVLANEAARGAYEKRLARMSAAELAAEVARVDRSAGDQPHKGPALAQLGTLADHLRARSGTEYSAARSAIISTRSRIAAGWKQHAELVGKLTQAARALDEVSEIAETIATGRKSPRLDFMRWRDKQQAA